MIVMIQLSAFLERINLEIIQFFFINHGQKNSINL